MKRWFITHVCCPSCRRGLSVNSYEVDGDELMSGVLRCQNSECGAWYPVVRGVPRLLHVSLRIDLTAEFERRFHSQLAADGLIESCAQSAVEDNFQSLKLHTIRNFGFEWIEYARHGWDEPVFNIQREREIFNYKSLLKNGQLAGRLVLDAGCGNGRYSYWAAQNGAKVIGIDLGDGVESAFANTRSLSNVQIVQADIFNLPFPEETFDVIFSIGVLMHTGDARRATNSLVHALKSGGSVTVHLYGCGNPIYELVDKTLRKKTTKLSIPDLQRLTQRLWSTTQFLERIHLLTVVSWFIRLDAHPHCIFDWYAAPVATHHTYAEVKGWFQKWGLTVVQTNEPRRLRSKIKKLIAPTTVTVRGEKST